MSSVSMRVSIVSLGPDVGFFMRFLVKLQKFPNRIHITAFHEGGNTLGRNIRGLHGCLRT